MNNQFLRTEILIGKDNLNKLNNAKVAVWGIGGVGSFVVEALVRAGIENIVLIDNDNINITNLNRQIHALHSTIGLSKVEVMKNRIIDINPKVNVKIHNTFFENNEENIINKELTYIVDAIDSVKSKLELIRVSNELNIPIISSMGTGNKMNPTMLEVSDIYKTSVCPLAKVIRKELRKMGVNKLKVVYSKEQPICCKSDDEKIIGSTSFVPSVAGLIIASEVVKDIINMN